MPRYALVQTKDDQTVYAVELDQGENVIRCFGPIPYHEVGHVLPGRYAMAEEGAATLTQRPFRVIGPDEIASLNRAYVDRRGMPVADGTRQDSTQPEARPESVAGPNPPEFGKPEGSVAIHDQGEDDAKLVDPGATADEVASGIAARATRSDTGVREPQVYTGSVVPQPDPENESKVSDNSIDTDDPEVMARLDSAQINPVEESSPAASEQYAPREGANLKPGADLRRAAAIGSDTSPATEDGRHTADAANSGEDHSHDEDANRGATDETYPADATGNTRSANEADTSGGMTLGHGDDSGGQNQAVLQDEDETTTTDLGTGTVVESDKGEDADRGATVEQDKETGSTDEADKSGTQNESEKKNKAKRSSSTS